MGKTKQIVTPAVRALRTAGIDFEPRPYPYVEHGGTQRSAEALGIDEHAVIKTIVLEDESANPVVVLMHGDRRVSTKKVAKAAGVRSLKPCAPATVTKHTGYLVGGTSPFGTRKPLPVYMQETISSLPRVVINGGKRGFLVELSPSDIIEVLAPTVTDVAVDVSSEE